ncbi:hypothetical protein GHT06_019135 [Daphnia sinensis]|uniref:PEHE domain-containing protein n=1 Tax=Daphnia sinensis TaxID=1820382 RepID=A0AAD5L265_9CRUS|nr:hypothetical protein GHT06_019135 [Daphnia sinensis]
MSRLVINKTRGKGARKTGPSPLRDGIVSSWMCVQHRQLDHQLGWMGSDDEVAINAMKCASVSLVYSLLSVHCAVAGNVAASTNNNPFVDIVRRTGGATPHQRCCPLNSSPNVPPSLTLLPKSHHSSLLKDTREVWPSRCCGTNGSVKTTDIRSPRNSSKCRRNSVGVIVSGQEIARSDELTKSRGGGGGSGGIADGQGTLDPPPTIVNKALAAPGPPPTIGQGTDLAHIIPSATAVAPRSSPPSSGGGGTSPSLNGNANMGLHPTAPGDRMDLDSPPLVVQTAGKTPEWSATTTTSTTDATTVDGSLEVGEEASVQDILDVIKSMEVEQCADIGLSAAEQQLLREAAAAVMEDVAALPVSGEPAVVVDKEAEVERRLNEARVRQQQIESRCQTLLRRAGRLQSRHVGRHVADQVAHFVTYAKETLSIGGKGRGGPHGTAESNLYGWAEDGRLPTREEVRNIPTATLVNLVSRLQAPPVSYLSNRRYFGLSNRCAAPSAPGQQQQYQSSASHYNRTGRQLSSQMAETLEEVAGLWEAQLRYLQRHDDPDATESSSGGETDDEAAPPAVVEPFMPTPTSSTTNETGAPDSSTTPAPSHAGSTTSTPVTGLPTPAPKPVSTYQRAAWRWARDRAAVAARWSWLQAQVSDLEYRIRQHTDVYRQLRAAKGPVQFATANGLTTSTSSSPVKSESSSADTVEAEATASSPSSSSRTRPLVSMAGTSGGNNNSGGLRHRRLIRASQIAAGSGRKPSRHSSTVRCCCVMSRIYTPCVLCNGKNNYLLPVDPDGMTLRERIGLTDRGFHPVLSLPQDIPLSAHVDSLLKSGDWRPPPPPQHVPRGSINSRRSSLKATQEDDSLLVPGSVKRKSNNKRKTKAIDGGSEDGKLDRRKALMKRRKRSALSTDVQDEDSASFPSSPYDTGSVQSTTPGRQGNNRNERSSVFQELMRRRTSYDIDNIVIPYSMAATTRVERLQYKEIQTPKWRTVDDEELAAGQEVLEDIEDVSEEACIARHDRSELEERRKFMSYLKQPSGVTRGRRRVDQIDRLDSRADQSSGANTPDPMSPVGSKVTDGSMMDVDLPVEEGERVAADMPTADGSLTASAIKERRRTASLTKRDSSVWKFHDDNSGMSWEMEEAFFTVAPYEPRLFPLSDSVYEQLVEEMPPEEADEDMAPQEAGQRLNKRETRSSECGSASVGVPVVLAPGATPTTTTSSVDDEAVTFVSESTNSPGADDLDIEDEDPNDPEWEGSQGSAPRSKKR